MLKSHYIWLILFFLFLIEGIAGGMYWMGDIPQKTEKISQEWSTFKHDKLDIEFDYPTSWEIRYLSEERAFSESVFFIDFFVSLDKTETERNVFPYHITGTQPFDDINGPMEIGFCAYEFNSIEEFCKQGCERISENTAFDYRPEGHGDIGYSALAYTTLSKKYPSICFEFPFFGGDKENNVYKRIGEINPLFQKRAIRDDLNQAADDFEKSVKSIRVNDQFEEPQNADWVFKKDYYYDGTFMGTSFQFHYPRDWKMIGNDFITPIEKRIPEEILVELRLQETNTDYTKNYGPSNDLLPFCGKDKFAEIRSYEYKAEKYREFCNMSEDESFLSMAIFSIRDGRQRVDYHISEKEYQQEFDTFLKMLSTFQFEMDNRLFDYRLEDQYDPKKRDQKLIKKNGKTNQEIIVVKSIKQAVPALQESNNFLLFDFAKPKDSVFIIYAAALMDTDNPSRTLYAYNIKNNSFRSMDVNKVFDGWGEYVMSPDQTRFIWIPNPDEKGNSQNMYLVDLLQDRAEIVLTLSGNETFNAGFHDLSQLFKINWMNDKTVRYGVFDQAKKLQELSKDANFYPNSDKKFESILVGYRTLDL